MSLNLLLEDAACPAAEEFALVREERSRVRVERVEVAVEAEILNA